MSWWRKRLEFFVKPLERERPDVFWTIFGESLALILAVVIAGSVLNAILAKGREDDPRND